MKIWRAFEIRFYKKNEVYLAYFSCQIDVLRVHEAPKVQTCKLFNIMTRFLNNENQALADKVTYTIQ